MQQLVTFSTSEELFEESSRMGYEHTQAIQGALYMLQHNCEDKSTREGQAAATQNLLLKHALQYRPQNGDPDLLSLYDVPKFRVLLADLATECGLEATNSKSLVDVLFDTEFSDLPQKVLDRYEYNSLSFTVKWLPKAPKTLQHLASTSDGSLQLPVQQSSNWWHEHSWRSAYIVLLDIDSQKQNRHKNIYKYRHRPQATKAVHGLICRYLLQARRKKGAALLPCDSKALVNNLACSWSKHQEGGKNKRRPPQFMWDHGTDGWSVDWIDIAREAYNRLTLEEDLPSYDSSVAGWHSNSPDTSSSDDKLLDAEPHPTTHSSLGFSSPRAPTASPLSESEEILRPEPASIDTREHLPFTASRKRAFAPDENIQPGWLGRAAVESAEVTKNQVKESSLTGVAVDISTDTLVMKKLRTTQAIVASQHCTSRSSSPPKELKMKSTCSIFPFADDICGSGWVSSSNKKTLVGGDVLQLGDNQNVQYAAIRLPYFSVEEVQAAFSRMLYRQQNAMQTLFSSIQLPNNQHSAFVSAPANGLLELYVKCLGSEWKTSAAALNQGPLLAFDFMTALVNSYLSKYVLEEAIMPWQQSWSIVSDDMLEREVDHLLQNAGKWRSTPRSSCFANYQR